MLTSATFQGGQDAAPDCGCKTPPSRLVLPPWFPTWPLTQRASWSGVRLEPNAAGYELAGHARPEQRGTALDRLSNVAVEIVGMSQRRTGRPRGGSRPRDGSRRPASTSWRTSFSECEGLSRTEATSPRPFGPSLTGPHIRNSLIQELDAPDRDRPTSPLCIRRRMPISPLDNQSPIRAPAMTLPRAAHRPNLASHVDYMKSAPHQFAECHEIVAVHSRPGVPAARSRILSRFPIWKCCIAFSINLLASSVLPWSEASR